MDSVIIIIDGYKFDVTTYISTHPGGKYILRKYNNKDATEAFNNVRGHNDAYASSLLEKYCIGKVESDLINQ
jgi:stearoyl-CoA desaturase (delta-9 desaturase)